MAKGDPLLIAGGGIAGLSLGLALARRGKASRILERNTVFSEAGAGIQIGPNGMGVLRRLGLAGSLAPLAAWPTAIEVRDGGSGQRLTRLPLGDWIAQRHGAPYGVIHRADLQSILLDAARMEPLIEIVTGFRVGAISEGASGVTVDSETGDRQRGSALVGADGLWSAVRPWVDPGADLNFSGKTASRTVVPIEAVLSDYRTVTTIWLMSQAHIVAYPVRGGQALACVVVVEGSWPGRGWGQAVEAETVLGKLAGADRRLLDLLRQAQEWRSWALYDPEALSAWSKGPVVLIGDAAHPVLPFLAQGGVMALEDAETLAVCLTRYGDDVTTAFASYEAQRRPRITRVQRASRRNGGIYHASGPTALARDSVLRLTPGGVLMRQYDWLYGWPGPTVPA
ncbi:MAG: FAD-dependent monooxygenase [Hyphomicrobiaceae bacterium]